MRSQHLRPRLVRPIPDCCSNPIARRERRKLDAPASKERVARDVQSVDAVAHEGGEGRLDLPPAGRRAISQQERRCVSCFTQARYDSCDAAIGRRRPIGRPLMHSAYGG